MKLEFTHHAQGHLYGREKDVSTEEIKEIITFPDDIVLKGDVIINSKKIAEKIVVVVYKQLKNKYLIITFYKKL